ncbi:MAG TPA: ATP-binding protein [Microbacteriaceae bacterium]
MESLSYSARGNVEKIIFRAFSIAVFLTGIEIIGNAFFQSSYLMPTHWILVALVVSSQVGLLYGTWLGSKPRSWMIYHGVVPFVVMALWPFLATDGTSVPEDFRPWVWWAMGMSAISLSVAFRPPFSLLGAAGITAAWFFFSAEVYAGSIDFDRRIQDSVLVLMLGGVFGSLAGLIIQQFGKVDQANSDSLRDSVARAQQDAIERERGLVDALVHDRVLNTLLLASKAKHTGDYQSAADSAKQALRELSKMGSLNRERDSFSSLALFKALTAEAMEIEGVVVSSGGDGSVVVPAEVAEALTQAALQALENSRKHSGAPRSYLHTESGSGQIVISIKDYGKGFRASRVRKNRLGLKLSIIGRVEAVGGKAKIISTPGIGAEVILTWTR